MPPRGTDNNRQGHDGQSKGCGENGCAKFKKQHEHSKTEQSIYNRWDPCQINDRDTDGAGQLGVTRHILPDRWPQRFPVEQQRSMYNGEIRSVPTMAGEIPPSRMPSVGKAWSENQPKWQTSL